ncbi:hypothetical protein NCC49_001874 [Naganishia albida]|nr:hypothetical protein NCC49_001874 [Naganishia albida]
MNAVVKEDDELLQDDLEDEEDLTEEEAGPAFEAPQGLIVGALKAPNTKSYSVKHLNELMHYGEIDLEPEYQRDVVWTEARQEALIDSLFHNYYIPPILFALRLEDDGTERRTCIDGKQRLTAIALFMSGLISCKTAWTTEVQEKPRLIWNPIRSMQGNHSKIWNGPGKGKRYWFEFSEEKHKGLALPHREKRLFETKTIVCAEFESLPEMAERDIFQRVQMGMALTPAEKLQALNTPYVKYITSLLQQYIYPPEGGLWNYLQDWERARGKDFQNLATIMQIIEIWPEKKTNFGAASLQSYLRRTDPIEDDLKIKLEAALECMVEIARDHQEVAISAISRRRISPLEFCFMGLISYVLRDYYSPAHIASLYGQYRQHMLSTNEKGVRIDPATISDSYRWLERVPKKKRNARPLDEPIINGSPNKG